jgi:hypothetical protein
MAISRRDDRRPAEAAALAGGSSPAQQAPIPSFEQRTAVRLVRLGVLRHMLQSPRFYERIALVGIVLAALRGIGQENQASTMARLSAWNKREVDRLEHKVERLEDKAKRAVES